MMALAALQAPAVPVPRLVFDSSSLSGGNENGTIDINECGELAVVLRNLISPLGETATGVVAELRSTTPGVVVDPSPQSYPDIPAAGTGVNLLPFRISTGPGYSCSTPASFSLRVTTGNAGEFNLNFQVSSSLPVPGVAQTFISTNVPRPIPDLGSVDSTILVTNLSQQIEKIRVTLHLTHSFDSDLTISLIGPDGTAVGLTANNGGSGANYGISCTDQTIFDDDATQHIAGGLAPFSGAFRPEQPLAIFTGKPPANANGLWTLRIRDLAAEDSGVLQCWSLETTPVRCLDGGGACLVPPTIANHPSDVTATNGGTAQFIVSAQGTDPLLYQWYFNGTNALEGATNASLTLENAEAAQAGAYSVVVSNPYGSAASTPAVLTLVSPPQIVLQPQDTFTTNGMTVQLSVSATGTAPLSYQWFFNETNLLIGATNAVLILTSASPATAGDYSVIVSNPYGSAASDDASITVAVPPFIVQQPLSLAAIEGGSAIFTVSAGGSEPLSYYWYFNETNLLSTTAGATLALINITPADAGGYSAIVSNAYGTIATVEAELSVSEINLAPLVSITQPADGSVLALDSGPIPVEAAASDADGNIVSVDFVANGTTIGRSFSAPYRIEWTDAPAGTSVIYAIAADNEGARATSAVATITVDLASGVSRLVPAGAVWKYFDQGIDLGTTWRELDFDDSLWAAGPAELGYGDDDEATVVSSGPSATEKYITTYFRRTFVLTDSASFTNLELRLLRDDGAIVYFNGVEIARDNLPEGETTFATLALSAVGGNDEQSFQTNSVNPGLLLSGTNLITVEIHQSGPASSDLSFDLELVGQRSFAPSILTHPEGQTVAEGSPITFSASVTGAKPLSHQWTFNLTNAIPDATNLTLTLAAATPDDSGIYTLVSSNAFGIATSSNALLTVIEFNDPPTVTLDTPTNGATFPLSGSTILLSATAEDADGSIDRVEFYSDGILLNADHVAPFSFEWIDAPLGSRQLSAVAFDAEGGASTSAVAQITIEFSTNTAQLVSTGAVWKYLDSGLDQGTAWRTYAFDDLAWSNGPAQLGYGDGDEATIVSFGPSPTEKFPTTYFRRSFVLTDAAGFTNAVIRLLRDDGAVVYLNEVEIFRSNLPAGEITFGTFASAVVSGAAESTFISATIDSSLLRNGTNLIAVELHQSDAGSSDISFDLELRAERLLSPLILAQPIGQSINRNGTATFSVTAFGTSPLNYQWYFNETNVLPTATNSVLEIDNAQPAAAGTYLVVVSNPLGSIASESAVLTVLDTNQPPAVALITPPSNSVFFADAGPILLEAAATDADGIVSQVEFFAGGTSLGISTVPPFSAVWLDAPLGTNNLWAIAKDELGAASTSAVAQVTIRFATNTAHLVSTGAVWKYLDTGSDQGTAWRSIDFNDSSWATGAAELGYGDAGDGRPETTTIGFGPDAGNKYITTYFRREFILTEPDSFTNLQMYLLRDDGAVVYLNGAEVLRSNLPQGDISFTTGALTAIGGTNESQFITSQIDPALLRSGANVIAVEIHQNNGTSSDISFDFALDGQRAFRPTFVSTPADAIAYPGNSVSFSASAEGTAPLAYQWSFNGEPLTGQTNPAIQLNSVTLANEGSYQVIVSNAFGAVTSQSASLTINLSNNPPAIAITSPASGSIFPLNSTLQIGASASDLEGAISSVTFYANGTLLGTSIVPPFAVEWLDAPLGSHVLQAVAMDMQGGSSTSQVVTITVNFASNPARLVSAGAVWNYLDTGVDQGTNWINLEFDDSAWARGPAELGYGDTAVGRPEATVVGFGPNANAKYPTTYFRKPFVLTDANAFTNLAVRLLRDDGAVVYLNGTEVFRSNMPTGTISFSTFTSGTIPSADETNYFVSNLAQNLLRNGTNVIAVEVHQANATSSDLSFDLELIAERGAPPFIVNQPASITVSNGATAVFTVVASGTTPIAYQWYRDQTNLLSGATNATLVIQPATVLQAGAYSVDVANALGKLRSSEALLTIDGGGNLPPLVSLLSPTNGARFDDGDPVTLQAVASDADGSVVSLAFYADGLLIGEVPSTPYEQVWTNASVGPHAIWAVATDAEGAATITAVANISVNSRSSGPVSLVSTGATWKYLDDGTDQGTLWRDLAFDDNNWPSGPAELGYGDETQARPEATVIRFGDNPQFKHITYYFRHSFIASAMGPIEQLRLDLLRDDGAIVYLNGVEVFRSNLPDGEVNYLTTASSSVSQADENRYFSTNVSPALLLEETNVLAVEVHQVNRSSSDLSFDLALVSITAGPPQITVHPESLSVTNHSPAEFSVAATGFAPLRYQWYFNATNQLIGETNATLSLNPVTTAQAGIYVVEVANAAGKTYSDPAILEVIALPPNLPPSVTLNTPADGSTFPEQSIIPLSATANDIDGSISRVEFFADGLRLGEAILPPYAFDWIGAPLGTHLLQAVAFDNGGASNTSATVTITVLQREPDPALVTLISTGAVWKYLDTGIDPGSEWTLLEFDDAVWGTGQAELGYGDAAEERPEATVLSFGSDANQKFPTYYFRHTFDVTNAAAVTALSLRVMRDDGVIVYLNGTEVFRDNLPGGQITFTNFALKSVVDEDEFTFHEATVPVGLLVEGTNVVAVEIHQVDAGSSDISFDFELIASRPDAPIIVTQPSDQTLGIGQTAEFSVTANGTLPMTYQWFKNSLNAIPGATNATLTIPNVQLGDEGSYSVAVANVAGTTRSVPAILRVLNAPTFESGPQSVTVLAGGSAAFSAVVSGAGQLSYRWFYNTNTELPGFNTPTIILSGVDLTNAGTYSVTVSNLAGSASSPPAVLRVLVPSQIIQISQTDGITSLYFDTVPGLRYTVDFKNDLNLPAWSLLPGAVKLNGTGNAIMVQDPGPVFATRFYRIRIE
ncbi:MAG: immunoglobulin domain-containing protein [Verrucomicrobia bacterium]|nr:immunoglobulin domain-containing protein [Verrucomicrobiota bacterium]